eukprot:TRINITY_DN40162_c0_g1_i1.p1 TRINITY_DN40162_c0_g1~~TRINITY_DN40162_c0_g1_i1.p1  ORF type:complete len:508 (+),score=268.73 TRINITY_DN40162_c0_g1_i1:50-1525(+)
MAQPLQPVSPPADGTPVNWEALIQESLQYEARRRKELDEHERERKDTYERWERERRRGLEEETARLRDAAAAAEQRRLGEEREAEARADAAAAKLQAELRELERRRADLHASSKEIEQRRKHLDQDQELSAAFVTRVTEQQAAVVDEVQRENDELRRRIAETSRAVADLQGRQEGQPLIDDVLRRTERFEEALAAITQAAKQRDQIDFVCSDQFAPVLQWLSSAGLTRYAAKFAENEFDVDACASLTERDLDGMGIAAVGVRRRLLVEAAALRERREAQQPSGPDAGVGGLTPRSVLEMFYQKYDAAKVPQVPQILKEYDLTSIFSTVAALYPIDSPSPYAERLTQVLSDVAPALLPCQEVLLDLYCGREVELMGYLMRHTHGVGGAASPQRHAGVLSIAEVVSTPPYSAPIHSPPTVSPRRPPAPPRPDDPPPGGCPVPPLPPVVSSLSAAAAAAEAREALAKLFAAQGTSDPDGAADSLVLRLTGRAGP